MHSGDLHSPPTLISSAQSCRTVIFSSLSSLIHHHSVQWKEIMHPRFLLQQLNLRTLTPVQYLLRILKPSGLEQKPFRSYSTKLYLEGSTLSHLLVNSSGFWGTTTLGGGRS